MHLVCNSTAQIFPGYRHAKHAQQSCHEECRLEANYLQALHLNLPWHDQQNGALQQSTLKIGVKEAVGQLARDAGVPGVTGRWFDQGHQQVGKQGHSKLYNAACASGSGNEKTYIIGVVIVNFFRFGVRVPFHGGTGEVWMRF